MAGCGETLSVWFGGDEARHLGLIYGATDGLPELYAVTVRDERAIIPIAKGKDAFLAWLSGPGIEDAELYSDALGAPNPVTYAVGGVGITLSEPFEHGAERARDVLVQTMKNVSRYRLAWEALQAVLDPDLRVSASARKKLLAVVREVFEPNLSSRLTDADKRYERPPESRHNP